MSFKDLASKENSLKKVDSKDKAAVAPSAPADPAAGEMKNREETKN